MKKHAYAIAVGLLTLLIIVFFFLTRKQKPVQSAPPAIPNIGSIQILNGCGTPGAAQAVSEFLRKKKFDVKDAENAPDWNYKATLIVSRVPDMTTASLVADSLGTHNMMLLRNNNSFYDVTVYVGEDFRKLTGTKDE